MKKIQGLGFSPYLDGQNPNYGAQISDDQIKSLISTVTPYTNWVRTYGCDHGLENIGQFAKSAGLKVAVGAWISRDRNVNDAQINSLISVVNSGNTDIAIVGSEVLLRNDLDVQSLIGYIEQVKRASNGKVLVTTADTYAEYFKYPELIAAVDVLCAHIYPFWEGRSFGSSIQYVKDMYAALLAKASGKTVWIGETGWPSAGQDINAAHPSPENAVQYFADFVGWARPAGINYFYFAFMDENWKGNEGGVGPHWGIFNANANGLKPGMGSVFK
jgi:exo-beta-1,3-glucanase (GH17 family)